MRIWIISQMNIIFIEYSYKTLDNKGMAGVRLTIFLIIKWLAFAILFELSTFE